MRPHNHGNASKCSVEGDGSVSQLSDGRVQGTSNSHPLPLERRDFAGMNQEAQGLDTSGSCYPTSLKAALQNSRYSLLAG